MLGDRWSGVWLASVPLLERPPCKAFNCGQRSCDQLSPKLAADCDGVDRRRPFDEGKANGHGWFHVESWRENALGRWRSWALASDVQLAGGAGLRPGMALVDRDP